MPASPSSSSARGPSGTAARKAPTAASSRSRPTTQPGIAATAPPHAHRSRYGRRPQPSTPQTARLSAGPAIYGLRDHQQGDHQQAPPHLTGPQEELGAAPATATAHNAVICTWPHASPAWFPAAPNRRYVTQGHTAAATWRNHHCRLTVVVLILFRGLRWPRLLGLSLSPGGAPRLPANRLRPAGLSSARCTGQDVAAAATAAVRILPPPAPAMADVSACPPGCHGTCGSPAMLTPA